MVPILHLYRGILGQSSRPTRIAPILKKMGNVTTCAYKPGGDNLIDGEFVELTSLKRKFWSRVCFAFNLLFRRYEKAAWNHSMHAAFERLKREQFALIVCQSLDLLPVACELREVPQNRNCKIVMDAREYYPKQREDSFRWRFFFAGLSDYLCRKYLNQADLVFTVSPGLQKAYAENYNVQCVLLPSYPNYTSVQCNPVVENKIKLVHHGVAAPGRKLEKTIEVARLLGSGYSLDFMLVTDDSKYLDALKARGRDAGNVNFAEPVPMRDISKVISKNDIGIFLLEPNTFNHEHALPNKLFEFIQASLLVAIGPSPDMAEVVQKYNLGIVSEDFDPETMARAIKALIPEQIYTCKLNSQKAAKELCWEKNIQIIETELKKLFRERRN